MRFYLLLLCALAFTFTGCPPKKPKPAQGQDDSGDVSFQAFAGRLRLAVQQRDMHMLASMMTPNFGYRWDAPPPGETPFAFWDANNLWPTLNQIMSEKWSPHHDFMVVPPQFATDSNNYHGYRAGVQRVNGSWKFSYFVPAEPGGEGLPPDAPNATDVPPGASDIPPPLPPGLQ